MHPDVYECRRADRDKDMGPQPAAALAVLALSPDKAAEYKRSEQTYQRIEEIADSKGVQESHSPRPPVFERIARGITSLSAISALILSDGRSPRVARALLRRTDQPRKS
jgi:hypothetical protein